MSGAARTLGGIALGVVLALLAVAGLRGARTEAVPAGGIAGGAQILSGASALAMGCQAHESALVHRTALGDEPVLSVRCVAVAPAAPAAPTAWPPYAQAPAPVYAAQPVASAPFAAPAVRTVAEPVVVRTEPVVVRQAPRTEAPSNDRSWQKSVMVIGGSTATGAGVGGLVGGRKGALVGAAIGGGASTIYESAKR